MNIQHFLLNFKIKSTIFGRTPPTKMDVINSNASDVINKKKHKRSRINAKIKQFSIEIYFMWFSALIFFAETFVGKGPLIHLFILKYIHLNLQINIPLFNLKIKKNYSKAEIGEITSKK